MGESNLTCKNWLHSMNWKLFLMNNKIWMVKVRSKRQVRMDKLEICAVRDSAVDPDVANAADALKRCVIGQTFIIVLLNVEVGHLHQLEHVDFIMYLDNLNQIAREFLNSVQFVIQYTFYFLIICLVY